MVEQTCQQSKNRKQFAKTISCLLNIFCNSPRDERIAKKLLP